MPGVNITAGSGLPRYPNDPQTAGNYLYEPAGSVHTFSVPDDATEHAEGFMVVFGANISFINNEFANIRDAGAIEDSILEAAKKRACPFRATSARKAAPSSLAANTYGHKNSLYWRRHSHARCQCPACAETWRSGFRRTDPAQRIRRYAFTNFLQE